MSSARTGSSTTARHSDSTSIHRSFRLTMPRFLSFSNRVVFCFALLVAAFVFTSPSGAQLATDPSLAASESSMSQQVTELQKVADRWDDAIDQHDQYALELVLAPQFI